jgi:hypothetical protein
MVTNDKLMEMFHVEELEQRLEMCKATASARWDQKNGASVEGSLSWEF